MLFGRELGGGRAGSIRGRPSLKGVSIRVRVSIRFLPSLHRGRSRGLGLIILVTLQVFEEVQVTEPDVSFDCHSITSSGLPTGFRGWVGLGCMAPNVEPRTLNPQTLNTQSKEDSEPLERPRKPKVARPSHRSRTLCSMAHWIVQPPFLGMALGLHGWF